MAGRALAVAILSASLLAVACSGGGKDSGGNGVGPGGSGGSDGSGGSGGMGGSGGSGGMGGSGGSGGIGALTCEGFAPCGGDVVGIWDMVETCVTVASAIDVYEHPACTAQPLSVEATFTGSIMYSATEETWNLQQTGTEVITVTAACLAAIQAGEGIDCAGFGSVYGATSSAMSGTDCVVTITKNETLAETTPYAVQGTNITYTGFSDRVPYCVSGDLMGQDWGAFVLLLEKR